MKISYTEQARLVNTSIIDQTSQILYKIDQTQDCKIISTEINSNIIYSADSTHNMQSFRQTEIEIPLRIIKNNSSLQSIVAYLKEEKNMKYAQIAKILNRDQRTIWSAYLQSKKRISSIQSYTKKVSMFKNLQDSYDDNSLYLPVDIFSSRNLSVLESIVFHLKTNLGLTIIQISNQLGKNYRTIWTVYKRAIKKISQHNG